MRTQLCGILHFLFPSSLQSALDAAVSMNDLSIVVDILNIINLQPWVSHTHTHTHSLVHTYSMRSTSGSLCWRASSDGMKSDLSDEWVHVLNKDSRPQYLFSSSKCFFRSLWKLDLCTTILPQIDKLLQSKYERWVASLSSWSMNLLMSFSLSWLTVPCEMTEKCLTFLKGDTKPRNI